jgi:hypothetical protein
MATAVAGGDTATGDVMAVMPTAMMAMPIPIAAATAPTAMERALWFATKTGARLTARILQHKAEAIEFGRGGKVELTQLRISCSVGGEV